jgi:ribosomal protein L12E/L44/L45/RPP1/RPP2
MTKYMQISLPEGWHDLNTEDRLKSLLDEVGIQVGPEKIEKALAEMEAERDV